MNLDVVDLTDCSVCAVLTYNGTSNTIVFRMNWGTRCVSMYVHYICVCVCVCVCESMCMDVYVKVYVCTSVYLCVFLCMCGLLAHSPVTSCPLMVAWLEQTAPIARTVMLKLSPHVRPLSSQLVSDVWHSSSRPIAPSAT